MEIKEPTKTKPSFNIYSPKAHAWSSKTKMNAVSRSRNFIVYVGSSVDLARIEERRALEATGRVSPSGYGPDE